jgi:subtilase family serine protease
MFSPRILAAAAVSATAVAGMMMTGTSGAAAAGASAKPALAVVPGSAVPFASNAQVIGDAAASQQLSIEVWLKPRIAAAQSFADAVSTPGSPLSGHYLSPDGYTSRFGPTPAQESKVVSWLRSAGFTGIKADSQRSYVRATATTARIDAAFSVQLKLYRSSATATAGPYTLRANDKAVSVPAALASSVLGVTGLDNATPVLTLERPLARLGRSPAALASGSTATDDSVPCSAYYGQHMVTGMPEQFGTTSFPSDLCGYSAGQLRAGYGASDVSTGKGQRIALVELGLTKDMFLTLQDYAKANDMAAPSSQRYSELPLGQGSACGDPFDGEEQIDVEASYDMAPGASQLVVGGDSCNDGDYGMEGLINADVAILDGSGNRPLASVASNSWESGSESQAASLTSIEHAFLVRAAAEGVGMYFSDGDGSGVLAPSSDPYAIAVGGTTLAIGKTGNRLFETGWSDGFSLVQNNQWDVQGETSASGGGPSLLWNEPGYQKRVVPADMARTGGDRTGSPVRSVPDISADADPFTGLDTGFLTIPASGPPTYSETEYGGTSLAAPLVAGMVAAAQQGEHRSFGFINPAIYKLVGTSALNAPLPLTGHSPTPFRGVVCSVTDCGILALITTDDQSTSMAGYTGQVTLKGYNNMTGVGTPRGQYFFTALRKLES